MMRPCDASCSAESRVSVQQQSGEKRTYLPLWLAGIALVLSPRAAYVHLPVPSRRNVSVPVLPAYFPIHGLKTRGWSQGRDSNESGEIAHHRSRLLVAAVRVGIRLCGPGSDSGRPGTGLFWR
jgi:hypothetical protein